MHISRQSGHFRTSQKRTKKDVYSSEEYKLILKGFFDIFLHCWSNVFFYISYRYRRLQNSNIHYIINKALLYLILSWYCVSTVYWSTNQRLQVRNYLTVVLQSTSPDPPVSNLSRSRIRFPLVLIRTTNFSTAVLGL